MSSYKFLKFAAKVIQFLPLSAFDLIACRNGDLGRLFGFEGL